MEKVMQNGEVVALITTPKTDDRKVKNLMEINIDLNRRINNMSKMLEAKSIAYDELRSEHAKLKENLDYCVNLLSGL